jgi:hypothetical protein
MSVRDLVRDLFEKSMLAVAVSAVWVAPAMAAESDFGKRSEDLLNASSSQTARIVLEKIRRGL